MTPRQLRRERKHRRRLVAELEAGAALLEALEDERVRLRDALFAAFVGTPWEGERHEGHPALHAAFDVYGMICAAAAEGEDLRPERERLVDELTALYEELQQS